jgi:hypothetical protein
MTMYFFHNVYGDEQELLDTLPEDVIAVPFGWTPEIEENRNSIINSLGITVSSIPSLFVFIEGHYADKSFFEDTRALFFTDEDDRIGKDQHFVESQWTKFNLLNIEKPWTWEKIFEIVNNYHKL